jgi:CheY-like chemotaxis protein
MNSSWDVVLPTICGKPAIQLSKSGEEAIALCKSDMAIDLIFTDINLIGAASGWDVGERFLADRPKVPVLYTSGQVIEPERCVPAGVFIAKPYQHNDILNACERLLSKWLWLAADLFAAGPREQFYTAFDGCAV